MNRWLGRPPRTRDEIRRLQACCDKEVQCQACPLRAENEGRSLQELLRARLLED